MWPGMTRSAGPAVTTHKVQWMKKGGEKLGAAASRYVWMPMAMAV
jgi:hypothetical protein